MIELRVGRHNKSQVYVHDVGWADDRGELILTTKHPQIALWLVAVVNSSVMDEDQEFLELLLPALRAFNSQPLVTLPAHSDSQPDGGSNQT